MSHACRLLALPLLFHAVFAVSIVDAPWEARKSNIIRVTRQPCDECSSLEDFYKDNDLVFLLFYERNLVSHHAYKGAIVAGFHEACKDLRWSRVACGIVDMLEDKVYAENTLIRKLLRRTSLCELASQFLRRRSGYKSSCRSLGTRR